MGPGVELLVSASHCRLSLLSLLSLSPLLGGWGPALTSLSGKIQGFRTHELLVAGSATLLASGKQHPQRLIWKLPCSHNLSHVTWTGTRTCSLNLLGNIESLGLPVQGLSDGRMQVHCKVSHTQPSAPHL